MKSKIKISNPKKLEEKIQLLDPNLISSEFPFDSPIPISSICLIETFDNLIESYYALNNVKKNYKKISAIEPNEKYIQIGQTYQLVSSSEPHEKSKIRLIKFYSEDVILRLVAAAEHLANSIINMLEIDKTTLKKYREKRSLEQITVGKYLSTKLPNNPITIEMVKIKDNPNWTTVMNYRHDWIHNQPPHIEGLGVAYKRKNRYITSSQTVYGIGEKINIVGGSDKSNYSIKKLVELCLNSYELFFNLFSFVVDYYHNLLTENDIDLRNNPFKTK